MTDFAWLIEAPGQRYLAVQRLDVSANFMWSGDANKALRFCSQEQTDAMMTALRQMDREFDSLQNHGRLSWGKLFAFEPTLGNAKPVEHGWLNKGGPTESDPNRPYCKPDQSCCDFVCGN